MDKNDCLQIINLVAKNKKNEMNYEEFLEMMTMEPEYFDDEEDDDSLSKKGNKKHGLHLGDDLVK